jgi:hypothetical protein
MTLDELTDQAYLASLDPELAALVLEWAELPCWRTMEALHSWIFARMEEALDRNELDVEDTLLIGRMIRKNAAFRAERHPDPDEREWNRAFIAELDRVGERIRTKARARLDQLIKEQ